MYTLLAKQSKSIKNIKSLTISAPMLSHSLHRPNLDTTTVVVLVLKYDFKGELPGELSISKGSFVKLIERPGNGWLKVASLEKYDEAGIIPASYVEIAVNDTKNPIDLQWLNFMDSTQSVVENNTNSNQKSMENTSEITRKHSVKTVDNDLFDFEIGYATSAVVNQVLQDKNNQIWYKIKVVFDNRPAVYIGKTYPEFYAFHGSLMNKLYLNLPKLPLPCLSPSNGTKLDKVLVGELNERCMHLHKYFNLLIQNSETNQSEEMHRFIFDGLHICNKDHNLSRKQIIEELYPGSKDINYVFEETSRTASSSVLGPSSHYSSFSTTAPLQPIKKSSFSTNLYQLLSNTNESNLKYSSYMTQKLPKEKSENSLASYTSLIDNYDNTTSDESQNLIDETSQKSYHTNSSSIDESQDGSYHTNPSSIDELSELTRNISMELKQPKTLPNKLPVEHSFEIPEKSLRRKYHSFDQNTQSSKTHNKTISEGQDIPTKSLLRVLADDAKLSKIEPHFDRFYDYSIRHFSTDTNDSFNSVSTPSTPIMHEKDGKFSYNMSPLTPSTPVFEEEYDGDDLLHEPVLPLVLKKRQEKPPKELEHDFIKIKIYLDNEEKDVIAVKIKRSSLISVVYLKKLLSNKIYKDYLLVNHYNLQVKNEPLMDDEQLLLWIKSQTKASLVLVRSRQVST